MNYWIDKNERACANCIHFYQHYIDTGYMFTPIFGGHCAYPRHKYRKVCDCCQSFEFRKDK